MGQIAATRSKEGLARAVSGWGWSKALFLLFGLSGVAVYWWSQYSVSFGERDAYRIYLGVLDAFVSGRSLGSELVYGYGISPGYFLFVEKFRNLSAPQVATALNLITFVSVMVALWCVYIIAARIGGWRAGALSAVVAATVPVWFCAGQYAHPMWPALALALLALSLPAVGDRLNIGARRSLDLLTAVIIGFAISCRVDVLLMSPMFLFYCVRNDRVDVAGAARIAAVGIIGTAIGVGIILILPPLSPIGGSIFDLLSEYHSLHQFRDNFLFSQLRFMRGLNIAVIILVIFAGIEFCRRREWSLALLTLPTVLLNYLFWIPNSPERHFLYMVPPMALAVGIYLARADWIEDLRSGRRDVDRVGLASAASFVCLLSTAVLNTSKPLYLVALPILYYVGSSKLSTLWPTKLDRGSARTIIGTACSLFAAVVLLLPSDVVYRNDYDKAKDAHFSRVGAALLSLRLYDRPVIVVSDGFPIATSALAEGGNTLGNIQVDKSWIRFNVRKNRIELTTQGWVASNIPYLPSLIAARAALGPIYVYVDRRVAGGTVDEIKGLANVELIDLKIDDL